MRRLTYSCVNKLRKNLFIWKRRRRIVRNIIK